MEINTPSKINPQYEINKTQIQTLLEPTTTKPDDKNGTRIYPYLSVDLCDNLIYQNVLLKTCIEVLEVMKHKIDNLLSMVQFLKS